MADPKLDLTSDVPVAHDCPRLPTPRADATPRLPGAADDNLTPQQRLAVAALVAGGSSAAAARAAGCARRTIYNRRLQPAFRRVVEAQSREALDVVVLRMRNLMLRATDVMGESLLDVATGRAPLHAMRVLNSARFWTIAERPAEAIADDADDADAPAASAGDVA